MELPRLEPLWQKYRDEGLSVFTINTYPDRPGALEFFEEHGLTFPQLVDRNKEYTEGVLRIYSYPTTLLLDSDSRVMFFKIGFEEGDEVKLEQQIVTLLKEQRPTTLSFETTSNH